MDYMLARYYSSSLGRFMEVDPAAGSSVPEDPQSWNLYAYSLNNPIKLVDPTGKAPILPEQAKLAVSSAGATANLIRATGSGICNAAPVVSEGANVIKKGSLLAAGGNAVIGNEPGALGALTVASGAGLVEVGADLTKAACDLNEQNATDAGLGVVETGASAVIGTVLDKAAPGTGKLAAEAAKEGLPALATAMATAIASGNGSSATAASPQGRPLVITTPEAASRPVITKKEGDH